jgi:hypothetical protein
MTASDPGAHSCAGFASSGRDPLEAHRSTTPLEPLYDLTIVVGIGTAANELAHYVADDHARRGHRRRVRAGRRDLGLDQPLLVRVGL